MRMIHKFAFTLIAFTSIYMLLVSEWEQTDKRFVHIMDKPDYNKEGKGKRSTQELRDEALQEQFKRGAVVTNLN